MPVSMPVELLNINESSSLLGPKKVFGMHALSCCDTVSYPWQSGGAKDVEVWQTLVSTLYSVKTMLLSNS